MSLTSYQTAPPCDFGGWRRRSGCQRGFYVFLKRQHSSSFSRYIARHWSGPSTAANSPKNTLALGFVALCFRHSLSVNIHT